MSDDLDTGAPVRIQPTNKRGGVWVTFGEEQYRIPPVGFAVLSEDNFAAEISSLSGIVGIPDKTQMQTAVKFVHAALIRNYPEMTVDQVNDMLDFGNVMAVLSAALGVGGFKARAATLGEMTASTGAASTAP